MLLTGSLLFSACSKNDEKIENDEAEELILTLENVTLSKEKYHPGEILYFSGHVETNRYLYYISLEINGINDELLGAASYINMDEGSTISSYDFEYEFNVPNTNSVGNYKLIITAFDIDSNYTKVEKLFSVEELP